MKRAGGDALTIHHSHAELSEWPLVLLFVGRFCPRPLGVTHWHLWSWLCLPPIVGFGLHFCISRPLKIPHKVEEKRKGAVRQDTLVVLFLPSIQFQEAPASWIDNKRLVCSWAPLTHYPSLTCRIREALGCITEHRNGYLKKQSILTSILVKKIKCQCGSISCNKDTTLELDVEDGRECVWQGEGGIQELTVLSLKCFSKLKTLQNIKSTKN